MPKWKSFNSIAVSVIVILSASAVTRAAPKRIVAQAPNTAEIICALGAGDTLVGVSPYCTYPPSLKEVTKVGGLRDPDLETILTLNPDIVILRGATPTLRRMCDDAGIRIVEDRTDTLDDLFRNIASLGDLLDRKDAAKRLSDDLRIQLQAIRKSAEAFPSRPRTLITVRSPDRITPLTTAANGSYLHDLIDLTGGSNVFADAGTPYPTVGLEEVLVRDPQLIIEMLPGMDLTPQLKRQLDDQWRAAGFNNLVEAGNVRYVTEDFALIPSPRVVQTAQILQAAVAAAAMPASDAPTPAHATAAPPVKEDGK